MPLGTDIEGGKIKGRSVVKCVKTKGEGYLEAKKRK